MRCPPSRSRVKSVPRPVDGKHLSRERRSLILTIPWEFSDWSDRPGASHAIDPHPPAPYTAALSERVAQMVEHVTFNHGVLGSIPSALTKRIKQLSQIRKLRPKPRVGTVLANGLLRSPHGALFEDFERLSIAGEASSLESRSLK